MYTSGGLVWAVVDNLLCSSGLVVGETLQGRIEREPRPLKMRPWSHRDPCVASSLRTVAEPCKCRCRNSLPRDCFCLRLFCAPGSLEKHICKRWEEKTPQSKDRNGEGSRWWELGAANGAICRPRLLISHAILQLAPLLPGTTPSLSHPAGREAL